MTAGSMAPIRSGLEWQKAELRHLVFLDDALDRLHRFPDSLDVQPHQMADRKLEIGIGPDLSLG